MRNIAGRRRVRHPEVATATGELNLPAAPLHCKAPMPLRRWSLGVVPVLAAAAIACNAAALANEPVPSVAAPRSEVSCHDQFMIDRRDEPARALRDLQQCNTLRDVAGRMEYFTFWYITRLPAMRHKQDSMFGEAWKNNLGLL